MIRLYIADTDSGFIRKARGSLARNRRIQIVGAADDGRRALDEVIRYRPDVLLTDTQLPGLDGFALLSETRRLCFPPAVIICTRFYTGLNVERALKLGASYFLCKPIDFDRLPETVLSCAIGTGNNKDAALESSGAPKQDASNARLLLNQLGISPSLNGCMYLVESVQSLRENELLLKNLSQGLYMDLAERLNTTVSRVERSLRSAISIGYERGAMHHIFSHRPTNREFIRYLMDALDVFGAEQVDERQKSDKNRN